MTDLVVAACCLITAFINSAWPPALLALHYVVFGAMAYGWNGVLHAQIARLSPKGMVSTATGGVMVWIFAGTLAGRRCSPPATGIPAVIPRASARWP